MDHLSKYSLQHLPGSPISRSNTSSSSSRVNSSSSSNIQSQEMHSRRLTCLMELGGAHSSRRRLITMPSKCRIILALAQPEGVQKAKRLQL